MLVLSRRKEESVVAAGSGASAYALKVTVLEIGLGQVRLGFEADEEVAIHRWEVWKRIHACGRKIKAAQPARRVGR